MDHRVLTEIATSAFGTWRQPTQGIQEIQGSVVCSSVLPRVPQQQEGPYRAGGAWGLVSELGCAFACQSNAFPAPARVALPHLVEGSQVRTDNNQPRETVKFAQRLPDAPARQAYIS